MKNDYFESIEQCSIGNSVSLSKALDNVHFNGDGLVPVVTQEKSTLRVLMVAWMNRQSLELTLETKKMIYWSRSRQSLWTKGETSGNTQLLRDMYIDCDGDSILCVVDQVGGACHTGKSDCFYWHVNLLENQIVMSAK